MIMGVFACLVIGYIFYWASVIRYGPQYYYEGFYALTLASAAGILWLAGSLKLQGWRRLRIILVGACVAVLVGFNLIKYTPARLEQLYLLYGVHPTQLRPFQTPQAQAMTPALVIVHAHKIWTEYAGLLELEDPWLTSPFIFAWSGYGPDNDAALARLYPGRRTIYYYPELSDSLYSTPR
jgi:hypothetical protein